MEHYIITNWRECIFRFIVGAIYGAAFFIGNLAGTGFPSINVENMIVILLPISIIFIVGGCFKTFSEAVKKDKTWNRICGLELLSILTYVIGFEVANIICYCIKVDNTPLPWFFKAFGVS